MRTLAALGRRAAVFLLALCAALALASRAHAAAVDGVSDQNLPFWDTAPYTGWEGNVSASPFAEYFRDVWTRTGHIKYARYVLQWNASAKGELGQFEAWYREVTQDLKLTPVLAFYNFRWRSEPNPTEAQYLAAIAQVLRSHPRIAVVEPWNEPNASGVNDAVAAHYANIAFSYCETARCETLVGDFLDTPGSLAYAQRYRRALDPAYVPLMTEWALHPYVAVNRSGSEAQRVRDSVMAHDNLWITEIGAYYCEERGAEPAEEVGEDEQQARAEKLLTDVIPTLRPIHVFYYEFLYKDLALTPCESGQPDTALYNPDDSTRTAARVIFGGTLPRVVRGEPDALLADANPGNSLVDWPSFGAEG
jgi:hypothetical protein